MKRKTWLAPLLTVLLTAAAAFGLWNLGRSAWEAFVRTPTEPEAPSRLVIQLNVGTYPLDTEQARTYTAQLDLDTVLALLQELPSEDAAPDAPDPGAADDFYSITLTYADGSTAVCYLIEDQFFRDESGTSYLVQPVCAAQLREFLKTHPGSGPTP